MSSRSPAAPGYLPGNQYRYSRQNDARFLCAVLFPPAASLLIVGSRIGFGFAWDELVERVRSEMDWDGMGKEKKERDGMG
jgi:hypothetical protein